MFHDWLDKGTYLVAAANNSAPAHAMAQIAPGMAWYWWVIILFITTFLIGIVAVLSGVGGGVLFTPIVGSFFPFGLDFVKAGGLLVALSGSLMAGPGLLRANFANLRLMIPPAIIASAFAIIGAFAGFAIPVSVSQILLGLIVFGIATLYIFGKRASYPEVPHQDTLGTLLGIKGSYYEQAEGRTVNWQAWRTPQGFAIFMVIGLIAGMFGLGAGWANTPVLNLVMGAPLKVAVGTSKFLLSVTDTSAAWVYFSKGAVLPLIVVPGVLGIMFGSLIGVKLLKRVQANTVRWIVIIMLLLAGLSSILKGLGIKM